MDEKIKTLEAENKELRERLEQIKKAKREYNKAYRMKHPEKVREWKRKWQMAHPEKNREYQNRYWLKKALEQIEADEKKNPTPAARKEENERGTDN